MSVQISQAVDRLPYPLVGTAYHDYESSMAWRGLMIDSARTYFPPATIKLMICLAARYGFNRIHWHLSDDQGWRINIPGYPQLTEIGATISRPSYVHYKDAAPGSVERARQQALQRWQNGWYRDDEVADIVSFAKTRGIVVVPEIDLPGHMAAAIMAYPMLGAPEGVELPDASREEAPHPVPDLLWPKESSFDFIDAVLTHLCTLFPSEYIHIGGDECAHTYWESDPDVRLWMNEQGVESGAHLQAYFMNYAGGVLQKYKRKPAVWDEAIALPGISPSFVRDALAFSWQGSAGAQRAAAAQRYVCADYRYLYLNYVDPDASGQKGLLPAVSLRDVYEMPLEQGPRCVGIQAQLWSEFIIDEADLLAMAFPRLLAVSERFVASGNWEDFQARASKEMRVLGDVLRMDTV
ncbi:MAG: family 20 glycosylhydrolase [Actinomycetaceae bacterium]|nr:family 20 glycosylhydrolase [Actinomycetaceae bacterium]